VTLKLHYGGVGSAVDVLDAILNLNRSVPPWVNLDPTSVTLSTSSSPTKTATTTTVSGSRTSKPVGSSPPSHPVIGPHSSRKTKLEAATSTLVAERKLVVAKHGGQLGDERPGRDLRQARPLRGRPQRGIPDRALPD